MNFLKKKSALKIGIIGFGFIAQHGHAPFYISNPGIEVVGVVDLCEARLAKASKYFPGAKCFSSPQEMFDKLANQVDVVDICTPPYAHYTAIVDAISNGCHVICEKPLATNRRQIIKLIASAKEQNRIIYPCHNYKFSPVTYAAMDIITRGYIGVPQKVVLHTYRTTHAKGVTEWKPNWRMYIKYSAGGILMDHGPHSIYMARNFLGKPKPTKVCCLAGKVRENDYITEDTVNLEIVYDTGQQTTVFLTWASSYRNTRYLIIGTSGHIEINDDIIKFSHNGNVTVKRTETRFNDPSHSNWFGPMFLDFQEMIKNPESSMLQYPLQEAFFVSSTINAGYLSSNNKGEWIPIRQIGNFQGSSRLFK